MTRYEIWTCDECDGRYPSPEGFFIVEVKRYSTAYGTFHEVDEIKQLCGPCAQELDAELRDASIVQKVSK